MPGQRKRLYNRAARILSAGLSKDEFVLLGEALDGDAHNDFLEAINEEIANIAPEVFGKAKPNG